MEEKLAKLIAEKDKQINDLYKKIQKINQEMQLLIEISKAL